MDLSFNLAPSYRDLKDPTSRRNFDDTVEQKRVIDLRACHMIGRGMILMMMTVRYILPVDGHARATLLPPSAAQFKDIL